MSNRDTSPGAEKLLDQYYPVLDHGFISLVDYIGSDQTIERAARVSYGKGTRAVSKTRELLRYLVRKQHTSPLEMGEMVFHVALPIFVARQWIRHRTANVNEASARYSLMPDVSFMPDEFRLQSVSNKQGSAEAALGGLELEIALDSTQEVYDVAWDTYAHLDSKNVARELSRIVTPVAAYTEWYWKIDLNNLLNFLNLRTDPHAQKEIRVYADIMAAMVRQTFPIVYDAWVDFHVGAITFTGPEVEMLAGAAMQDYLSPKTEAYWVLEKHVGMGDREKGEFRGKISTIMNQEQYKLTSNFQLPTPLSSPEEARLRLHPETA